MPCESFDLVYRLFTWLIQVLLVAMIQAAFFGFFSTQG